MDGPVVLDSDTLSDLSRGHPRVIARAREYLERHGRLTFTAVTVFERLRGYRAAIAAARPYGEAMAQFQALSAASIVLPLDEAAADRAVTIWTNIAKKQRQSLGDILIAAIAASRGLPLVTRHRRDFDVISRALAAGGADVLELRDWTK